MTEEYNLKARNLVKKYLEGKCSQEEKAIVEDWYLNLNQDTSQISDIEASTDLLELQHRLSQISQPRTSAMVYIRTVAAAVLLFLTIGVLWFVNHDSQQEKETVVLMQDQDVMPGTNRAVLALDGEQTIELDNEHGGLIFEDNSIVYTDGKAVGYVGRAEMATLSTPVAGQYKLTLSDGTKVWLNALSSISYPTKFTGDTRTVRITGEVYFEVMKNPHQPFIVYADRQRIEVLGTSFNVNAYSDNAQILTTLAEGSLRVTQAHGNSVLLKPGQQAIVGESEAIEVKNVETQEISSWKDGIYIINDEPLARYAKQIERWYDVEVDMGTFGKKHLSAIIPRDAKLSEVLQAIELKTGVKFKIEERRVRAIQ